MSARVFQSFLGPDIEQFIAHKRSLGRRYDVEKNTLALLDSYLLNNKIGNVVEITPAVVDGFLLSRPRTRPRSYNHLRCTVGRLFSYLVDHEKLAESTLRSPPRRRRYQRAPFIFEPAAAHRLLAVARTLPSNGGTIERGSTYFGLFAVLYGLGLRVGEVCRLCLKDVDLEHQLLIIRETKFYKSRLVPFGPKLGALLAQHLQQRQAALEGTPSTLTRILIPPGRNAKTSDDAGVESDQRDANIRHIDRVGRRCWQRESGYTRRSLVETAVSRFKNEFGGTLASRTMRSQVTEVRIACSILNTMTKLGMPDGHCVS